MQAREQIRNIAIIAHVDHGKTTLVDYMLRQTGVYRANETMVDRAMDTNELEREKGISYLVKKTAVTSRGDNINIDYTPVHYEYWGELKHVMVYTNFDYNYYFCILAIGRLCSGSVEAGQNVAVCRADGSTPRAKVVKIFAFEGLKKVEIPEAGPGEIISLAGIEEIAIGDTIADPEHPIPLERIHVDEPTMSMVFKVNDGPFAGREGKYVTSRNLRERLQ